MQKLLFFGLGHLGDFFLKQNKTLEITATKRTLDKEYEIKTFPFELGQDWNDSQDYDAYVISFPPPENYATKLSKLLSEIDTSKKVVFISSTSVFGTGIITEESERLGTRRNALELIKCEKMIEGLKDYVIIRPGGLIDEKRHPKNFTKRMTYISKSKTNVNLVHTGDVAAFIHHVLKNDLRNTSYNLTCDDHPTKEAFYGRFNHSIDFDPKDSQERIIENQKSKNSGFDYQYKTLVWCDQDPK